MSANFSNTTPAADSGYQLAQFKTDGTNISVQVSPSQNIPTYVTAGSTYTILSSDSLIVVTGAGVPYSHTTLNPATSNPPAMLSILNASTGQVKLNGWSIAIAALGTLAQDAAPTYQTCSPVMYGYMQSVTLLWQTTAYAVFQETQSQWTDFSSYVPPSYDDNAIFAYGGSEYGNWIIPISASYLSSTPGAVTYVANFAVAKYSIGKVDFSYTFTVTPGNYTGGYWNTYYYVPMSFPTTQNSALLGQGQVNVIYQNIYLVQPATVGAVYVTSSQLSVLNSGLDASFTFGGSGGIPSVTSYAPTAPGFYFWDIYNESNALGSDNPVSFNISGTLPINF